MTTYTHTTCPTCDYRHSTLTNCTACEASILTRLASKTRNVQLTTNPDQCSIVIDGSMYAPSHRAIPGMEEAWQADPDPDHTEYLIEGIEDWIDAYHTGDYNLAWDEGILFLYGPDYDHPDAD